MGAAWPLPTHNALNQPVTPVVTMSVSTTRAFCIRGKTCANTGAVVWGSNEFNPGCFEGSLNFQQRRRSAWRYAVALFETHQCSEAHSREFRKSMRRPSKSGSGTSNLDTRQH
jgi:hypothetical protein